MKSAAVVIMAVLLCGGSYYVVAQKPLDTGSMDESIQSVKQKYNEELMSRDGVIAVGIGLNDDGQPAIIVTVEQGRSDTAAKLPDKLDGYPVLIQYSDQIRAQ